MTRRRRGLVPVAGGGWDVGGRGKLARRRDGNTGGTDCDRRAWRGVKRSAKTLLRRCPTATKHGGDVVRKGTKFRECNRAAMAGLRGGRRARGRSELGATRGVFGRGGGRGGSARERESRVPEATTEAEAEAEAEGEGAGSKCWRKRERESLP
ncbi:hypothetical protein NL676_001813 [Syzygium grande]|nr:hypothetical protein NL676_001813 [Syzygium grande]